ncbi:MAG: SGNH/GDSL hydrolase family protein [Lachnospiraceae bacterium]|nr:SGNH/GDSL hydrolase family protein [Lachnospiraceae bacterium]
MTLYDGKGNKVSADVGSTSSIFTQHVIPEEDRNLFDPTGGYDTFLLFQAGTENTAFTNAVTTPYYEVTPGQIVSAGYIAKYYKNPWFEAVTWYERYFAIVFYDSSKTYIGAAENSNFTGEANVMTGVEVPEGAAYVRISIWCYGSGSYYPAAENPEWMFVYIKDEPYTTPTYWFEDGIEKSYISPDIVGITALPPTHGKTWVIFGDSTADAYGGRDWQESTSNVGGEGWTADDYYVSWTGYFWASGIARELGLTIDNRAASGSNINISDVYTDVSGVYKLQEFIEELDAGTIEPPDYITMHFGANSLAREIGTADDTSENTDTVYGAMKYFIETLREKCPYASIGFVLPYQCMWSSQSSIYDESQSRSPYGGRNAMKAVLDTDEYHVPYIDLWTESGITTDMLCDNIHESTIEAMTKYYHAVRRFMLGL